MKQCSRSHVRVVATVLMLCVVLTGVGCTQRDGSSRGILMEGRIAPLMPTDSSDRWLLTRDRVDRYIKDLADNGPQPGHRRGDAFLWFPSRDLAGKPSEIIISKYKERWYVLVCNQPDRIMLPRKNGRQVWGLIKCEAYPDEERGNLIFEFDYAGEQRFDRLRKQNPRRPLLFLIDGKFHISVWPGPKHDPNALLGYKIFEEPPPVSEVAEAAVVPLADEIKGRVPDIYVSLKSDYEPSTEIEAAVTEAIETTIGKIARPKNVHIVPDMPKTRSGKIMRRVLAAISNGRDLGDVTTLANPDIVDEVRRMVQGE